jgi:hypothetical protein
MSRRCEEGQILPLAALMMVVLVGMAALSIDGGNMYSQHRKLQSDLDSAVKVAAANTDPASGVAQAATLLSADGYPNNLVYSTTGCHDGSPGATDSGISICTPPVTGLYKGRPGFVEGSISTDIHTFFAGVLGLAKMHVSVRAVAKHGGGHRQPYAIIGLNPTASICGIQVQSGSNVNLTASSSIYSDSQSCIKSGTANISGISYSVDPTDKNLGVQIGAITSTNNSPIPNPTSVDVPEPLTTPVITICGSGCTYKKFSSLDSTCLNDYQKSGLLPSDAVADTTYYFPPNPSSSINETGAITDFVASKVEDVFLPHCDSPDPSKQTAGIYYFTADKTNATDIQASSGQRIVSHNSSFVLDPNYTLMKMSGGSYFSFDAPYNGPLKGFAIWENQPCSTTPPQTLTINGGATDEITGTIDAACANIALTGSSTSSVAQPLTINGAVIGWIVGAQGSGSVNITYNPGGMTSDLGSVLVE